MSGMEDVESSRNAPSISSDRNNNGGVNHVSVDSSSLRTPVDSMLGDDHHQLLGERPSTVPLILSSSWGGRPRNQSSKSSSTRRSRYRNGGATRTKVRRRVVLKSGECNVLQSRVAQRRLRYLQDIFTTLVDTQWRWTLLVFALSFILSWLGFALIWWLIAFTHGDFEPGHLPDEQEESGWKPCIHEIYTFASCFLFSIETQHTIGYGSRSTSEECPEAIFVMCLQSITGVMIQAFMVGIVFAKMSRPKQRAQTLLFSRNAVVCLRDGDLCLMFRVGDMRKSHIIGATVRAQLIRTRTTKEGELLYQHQAELNVGTDGGTNSLFFIWPMTVVHRIDSDSPLYNISASDIIDRESRFEIVVILEGTIESTGQTTQARSSYLPNEVLWGHRFQPMVVYNKERQGYEVDYSRFNNTDLVDTPLCSARDLERFYQLQHDLGEQVPHQVRRRLSDTVSSLYSTPASLVHVPASVISSSESSPQNSSQLNSCLWALPVEQNYQNETSSQ
ncbi:ATP-sensitive inward rectifier potassium channel 11-like isoform X4 [Periplaneta americana]|uniref:ATP-sensitive inward rectifier potassium channel 11-like isoform X4 n=1 Tax=Periplaneta americana TaxID=6978 RepID=UPI0037E8EDC7